MSRLFDVNSSVLASTLSGWRGTTNFKPAHTQPTQPLELYEFEGCPYCRLLRESLTELDLDVLIKPCPKDGTRFRPQVKSLGGKTQFPFLVDPNSGTSLYESADIVDYLIDAYGGRSRFPGRLLRGVAVAGGMAATASRVMHGMRARPSKAPQKPLELYSFESSPFSRLVRERLCELELPYLLRNTGKARWTDMGPPSFRDKLFRAPADTCRNRSALHQATGRVQVPYLIDPNTGTALFESAEIIRYLDDQYAA